MRIESIYRLCLKLFITIYALNKLAIEPHNVPFFLPQDQVIDLKVVKTLTYSKNNFNSGPNGQEGPEGWYDTIFPWNLYLTCAAYDWPHCQNLTLLH